jgi:hypothetical protein
MFVVVVAAGLHGWKGDGTAGHGVTVNRNFQ